MPYAVVTGGSQGMGKAIAEKFLQNGFSVAICARSKQDLERTQAEWNEKYPASSVLIYAADLAVKEEVRAFCTYVLANFEQIDVLVNNAGTYFPGQLATEADGQLEKLMGVNVYSAYNCTRALLPVMKAKKQGHIFNMCSIASLHAYPNGGTYSITKYAVLGFSENLRLELMPDNIKVTSICPGATYTRSWEGSGLDRNRFMQAEDIAEMIWTSYNLSPGANVDTIVIRPTEGDI